MKRPVLIVRHGPGRGRKAGYLESTLEAFRARGPEYAARLRVFETGAGPPPDLDGVAAVVFWLADPLKEAYPDCYAEAAEVDGEARRRGIPRVNPPDALSNTVKSRQSRLWLKAGIETPRLLRFETMEELPPAVAEVGFPAIVRSDEEHYQQGMRILEGPADLEALGEDLVQLPGAVAPLIDVRAGYRERGDRSIYARLHHKKRIYVLGDEVCTEHVFFSERAVVSARGDVFDGLGRGSWWRRAIATRRFPVRQALAEDLAYWRKGEEHRDLMVRAAKTLGLGFAALDYSVRADGSAVLWEANPFPNLPTLRQMRAPDLRKGKERIAAYHRAVGDFLVRLGG